MAKAEGIPPTASVASVGPSIRYIGNWAYAYSGIVDVEDLETDLINATSGNGYIISRIQFHYGPGDTSDDFFYRVRLNGEVVVCYGVTHTLQYTDPDNYLNILIPPVTEVRLTALRVGGSGTEQHSVTLTGRVYGAE